MRIAIFYNLAFGGAKRVVMEHAKGLKRLGHTIDLYTTNLEKDAFDPSPYCNDIFSYTIDITSKTPLIKRFISDYKNFFVLKKLHKEIAKDIDQNAYDVILVHPDKFTQSPFLLQFLKTKNYYYCQEPLRIVYEYSYRLRDHVSFINKIYEEITRYYRKKIDRDNVRSAWRTITSCYHVRERMIESYEVYPHVVYCAVNDKTFRPIKAKKKNQVFFVGSPNVIQDGYDLAHEAVAKIPSRIRPRLHIVEWKKKNGERLSEEELVTLYNESIVTLSTSRLETFGLVPLESMACGVPVIATNVSGHRETVKNNETGFLVDFDSEEIAEKIQFLMQHPQHASEMGRNARTHIKTNWNWGKHIVILENVLQKN